MSKEDEMIELLEELVKWTKVTSIPHVKKLLLEILETPEEKIAYQFSDGKTSREVAKEANVSVGTISNWWKKWSKAGIAEAISVKGGGKRARRLFSLDDFGVELSVSKGATAEEGNGGEEEP